MKVDLTYIDLFAGAGGLSEGFARAGFKGLAYVEMNSQANDTLRTRAAFRHHRQNNDLKLYTSYLQKQISKEAFWKSIPKERLDSIILAEINEESITDVFKRLDRIIDSKKVDLIVGGPPCQAYSLVGRGRDPKGMKWDKRNFLFRYYAQFLSRYKPNFFVFENVLGLLSAGNSRYLKQMLKLFAEVGYSVDWQILNAEDFGVLQKRRRVFIVGRRGKKEFNFPTLQRTERNWQIKKDLFFDLPTLQHGQAIPISQYVKASNRYLLETATRNGLDFVTQNVARRHNDRDLEIYAIAIDRWLNDKTRLKYSDLPKALRTHKNTLSFLDRYKVVDPVGHSHTVVAHISQDGHYYIYPDLDQVRSISIREAARIQSFPDDYFFEGGRTAAFKQIGNAVPPLLAFSIANAMRQLLQK